MVSVGDIVAIYIISVHVVVSKKIVSLNHFASSAGRGSASDCAKRLIAMRIAALVLVLPFFALRYLFTLTKSVLSSRVKLIPIRIVISLTMTE